MNSFTPQINSMATIRNKKVIIKNNRGPWKIANHIFKRGLHRREPEFGFENEEELAEYHLTARNPSKASKSIDLRDIKARDGLMVNQRIVQDSIGNVPKLVIGSWMKVQEPNEHSLFPISSKFVKTTSKLPIEKIDEKEEKKTFKPKSLKFKSDIEVIDLMEVDSIINSSFKRKNSIQTPVDRKIRSLISPLSSSDISSDEKIIPIKIYVFVNPNHSFDSITESSERIEVGAILRRPMKTTTQSITTSTISPLTTASNLKKLDLNEFKERISFESEEDVEKVNTEEKSDKLPEVSVSTPVPISRNWNFICGERKGFFADVENDCRAYYQCSDRGRQRFECPHGTKFNQFTFVCDWNQNVNCSEALVNFFGDNVENRSEAPLRLITNSWATPEPDDYE